MTIGMPDWASEIPSAPVHQQPAGSELTRPFTAQQLLEIGEELIEQFIKRVVLAIVGHFIPGEHGAAFEQLRDWALNLPLEIVHIVIEFLKTASLEAKNLVGQILARLLPPIHVGRLTAELPSLVADGGFDVAAEGDSEWHNVDGVLTVTADGAYHELVGAPIQVAKDQQYRVGAQVGWSGATGGEGSVQVAVVEYLNGDRVGTHVAVSATPDGTQALSAISGDYVVPEGVDEVAVALVVTEGATAGTIQFDNVTAPSTGGIQQSWVTGLLDALQAVLDRWHLLIGTIVEALGGQGDTLEDLALAVVNIPAHAIKGVLGAVGLDDDLQSIVNILAKAMGHTGSGNASLGDLLNLAGMVKNAAGMGRDALGILGIRNAEGVQSGLLATGDSNYPFANANTWVAVNSGVAKSVTHRIGIKSRRMGVVSWYGYGNVGITGFYVIALGIDAVTGLRTVKHVSPNIAGLLPPGSTVADRGWVFYEIETADAIDQAPGEDWEYALLPIGGTHHVWGLSYADAIVDHPYAQVKSFGFEHTWASPPTLGTTVTKAAATSSPDVCWIETAIETGNTASQHEPMWLYLGTEPTEIVIPNWCGRVIAVGNGGGGGGRRGGSAGFAGDGGEPGKFAVAVWDRGTHFPLTGTTVITLTPGTGGAGGASLFSQNGKDGGDTTLSIPDFSVTAEGGKGGVGVRFVLTLGKPVGRGAGAFTYEDWEFDGGLDQNAYGGAGIASGGAGNGGDWLLASAGGPGADGGGWVVFLPGEPAGATLPPPAVVNVPPPPPVISLDSATFSSITVNLAPGVVSDSAMRVRSVGVPKLTQFIKASSVSRTRSVSSPTVAPALPKPIYDSVGSGATGAGVPGAFNITVPAGADVFVAITTDRVGGNITGAKLGGTTNNTAIASVNHNNVTTYGTTKIFRFAGAGTGSPQSVQALGSGTAWWLVETIAWTGVNAVGTPTYATGSGNSISQVTTSAFGFQVISAGGNGASVGSFSAFTGVTNRKNDNAVGAAQAINTATTSGTKTATLGSTTPWAATFIPLS